MNKGKTSILPYKNFFEILNAIPPHYSINNHPLIVRFYCCDMHNGFVSVAKEIFPHAIICIDMCHVIKHLNECVSSIRVQLQRAQLTKLLEVYCSSEVLQMRHVANMVRHWRGYIQNTWKYNKSNGVCEGYNNRIKVLKRIYYGLHNFESFRKRILLTCGSTQFVTNRTTLFQRNRTKKVRSMRKSIYPRFSHQL